MAAALLSRAARRTRARRLALERSSEPPRHGACDADLLRSLTVSLHRLRTFSLPPSSLPPSCRHDEDLSEQIVEAGVNVSAGTHLVCPANDHLVTSGHGGSDHEKLL